MWKRAFVGFLVSGLAVVILGLTSHQGATQPGKDQPPPRATEAPPPAKPDPASVRNQDVGAVKIAPSHITAVTVYPNSALVTREVDVPEGQGTVELIVNPLPPATLSNSLYTEGTDGIRVLTTRFRTRPILEDTREEVRTLQNDLKQLALAREKLEADSKAYQENDKTLTKMESFMSVTIIQATEKGALNTESAIALSKYIREARLELARELIGLKQQVQANQDKAEVSQRRLTNLSSGTARIEQDAVIVVEKNKAGTGKVRLNYLVTAASWLPQYKLRAGAATKDPVQVEYLAAVAQQTGEDWSNVNLVLSTASPMLNAAPPELQTLDVSVIAKMNAPGGIRYLDALVLDEQIRNISEKAQKDFNAKKQASGIGLVNTAAALDQSFELSNPDEAMKRGCPLGAHEGPTVTYHLATKLSVPSRPDEQMLEVARLELTPDYYYKAVPILTAHVYRLADLINKSDYVLLPGDATMYVGSDFVGQMSLPLVAIGEQFTASFGVDPQLQVQRQMIAKSRTTTGANQALRYEFRILVSSYKTEPIKLQLWDRLPHAVGEVITVSLLKTAPELSTNALYLRQQRPNDLLRWDVTVEPKSSGEKALAITYEFKMELDSKLAIGSFQTPGAVGSVAPPENSLVRLSTLTPAELATIRAELAKLSPEDRKLAEAQVFCAVDQGSPLGSIGPIQKVMIKGQPVFLCCKGCLAEAQTHPDETLVQFQKMMSRMTQQK